MHMQTCAWCKSRNTCAPPHAPLLVIRFPPFEVASSRQMCAACCMLPFAGLSCHVDLYCPGRRCPGVHRLCVHCGCAERQGAKRGPGNTLIHAQTTWADRRQGWLPGACVLAGRVAAAAAAATSSLPQPLTHHHHHHRARGHRSVSTGKKNSRWLSAARLAIMFNQNTGLPRSILRLAGLAGFAEGSRRHSCAPLPSCS